MKLPWTKARPSPKPDPAAKQALADATYRLRAAQERQPEVDKLARWARKRREMNHLSKLFFDDLQKNHQEGKP